MCAPDPPSAPLPSWHGVDGVLPEIAEIAGLPPRRAVMEHSPEQRHMRYVEDKRIDWQRVEEIAVLSERARQWTNFGPVSQALERVLEHLLRLPPERAVIMCASATVGLHALAGICAIKLGRTLRWAVCSYTFFSQRTGPFVDATLVDCDDHGLIDLDAVDALPEAAWDGLVVTNLFAGLRSARTYADFCTVRGKALMIDSAAALFGPDRGWPGHPNEAISFHHTKPWGVGEGGCIIVDRADAELARSVINFGIGGGRSIRSLAGNGKLSDVASAPILERLERLPAWAPRYRAQRTRIEQLCELAQVPMLLEVPAEAISASVPVLANVAIERAEFAQHRFDVGKYYPPLDDAGEKARRIFSRIINIPAHPGMAAIETADLQEALQHVARAGKD